MPPKSKSSRPLEGGNTRQIRSNVKGKKGRRGTVENGHTKNKPHSHFLALAPEIRNRIYYFTKEFEFIPHHVDPPLLIQSSKRPSSPYKFSARNYFGLTQTCKQLRSEFRPLWLRDSVVRINPDDLHAFVITFYPNPNEYHNAPRLLFVNWDHDGDYGEDLLFDMTALFHLRAHCPTFTARFICRKIAEDDYPNNECWECGHSMYCLCDNGCDHDEARTEAYCDLRLEYEYTEVLHEFLANKNEAWLETLRKDVPAGMRIQCTIDLDTLRPTIYIWFEEGQAPACFSKENMYSGSVQYLTRVGILDLDQRERLDFVIGEDTGKCTRHSRCCYHFITTFNQVHVSGSVEKIASDNTQV